MLSSYGAALANGHPAHVMPWLPYLVTIKEIVK